MKYEYGLRLLGSARGFAESAVTRAEEYGSFNWYPSSEWKFAVVHLATALELLLKARIAIEDPLLLGANGTISGADLESGRFRSVTIQVALRRLKQLGLVLTDEQRAALAAVSDLRNRLVHFTIEEDRARFMSVFTSGLNLFLHLAHIDWDNCSARSQHRREDLQRWSAWEHGGERFVHDHGDRFHALHAGRVQRERHVYRRGVRYRRWHGLL